jgi:hypothetical protein
MNKKTKLVVLLVLVAAVSVIMLSSCSLVYSGKYKATVAGVDITLELGLAQKATITEETTLAGVKITDTQEYIYAVDYSKKIIIIYKNADDRKADKEVMQFKIVSRNELEKGSVIKTTYKRDGFLPSFTF